MIKDQHEGNMPKELIEEKDYDIFIENFAYYYAIGCFFILVYIKYIKQVTNENSSYLTENQKDMILNIKNQMDAIHVQSIIEVIRIEQYQGNKDELLEAITNAQKIRILGAIKQDALLVDLKMGNGECVWTTNLLMQQPKEMTFLFLFNMRS